MFVASPSELRCLKVHFEQTLPAKNQQLFSFKTIGLRVVKLSHCILGSCQLIFCFKIIVQEPYRISASLGQTPKSPGKTGHEGPVLL
jgi:hypothetical protein